MHKPSSMKAAVLAGPKKIEIQTVPRPDPDAGQVRIRLEGCGLCGSNGPTWEGRPWTQYPLPSGAPGHEGWGVVDALGRNVSGVAEGERVAFLSGHAFAEYDLAQADQLVKLPAALDGQPFPGEPLGCAMNIFRRADVQRGQTVAVVGIGFLGAIVCKLAKDAGARVIAITRRPWALDVARTFGADERVPMDDHGKIIATVKALTGGRFCERVVEVTGEQWPLDLSGELCAERGKLIIAGYHQDPRSVNMQLWNWRGLDVINAHERDPKVYLEGIRMAVDAVVAGRLDPKPLFTHRFKLEQLDRAFEAMKSRPDGFLKALVTP